MGITTKAVARAAMKFTMAEGATRGAQQAAGKDAGPWVALAVGLLTNGFAMASEEADKRSWRHCLTRFILLACGCHRASIMLKARALRA